jgi:hypothetical protein
VILLAVGLAVPCAMSALRLDRSLSILYLAPRNSGAHSCVCVCVCACVCVCVCVLGRAVVRSQAALFVSLTAGLTLPAQMPPTPTKPWTPPSAPDGGPCQQVYACVTPQ